MDLNAFFKIWKNGSSFRDLDFQICLEDLEKQWEVQNGKCYYSGIDMTMTINDPNKVSMDRLDSSIGYYPENIVLCTSRINLMKKDLTLSEFAETINLIAARTLLWNY